VCRSRSAERAAVTCPTGYLRSRSPTLKVLSAATPRGTATLERPLLARHRRIGDRRAAATATCSATGSPRSM
jgi:hypothetical protein